MVTRYPDDADSRLLPDNEPVDETPAGVDRRTFLMRSAVVGAAISASAPGG